MKVMTNLMISAAFVAMAMPLVAQQQLSGMGTNHAMTVEGLVMPQMDASKGRKLFATKGCVVCHSINGVGGEDAQALDAETMEMPMNPFEFAARMWRGAGAMVELQEVELGGQIELDGDELAAIIAFVHDAKEQAMFSDDDIPEEIEEMMHLKGEEDHHDGDKEEDHG